MTTDEKRRRVAGSIPAAGPSLRHPLQRDSGSRWCRNSSPSSEGLSFVDDMSDDMLGKLLNRISSLEYYLKIYINAHENGNSVSPFTEKEAKDLLKS